MHWAKAVLCNSLCRYDEALAAAQQASDDSPALWFSTWGLVELIEAAARSGVPEHAHGALQRLSETTLASGTDWALGVEARSRALLSDGEVAESLYRQAMEHLARTPLRVELGRCLLVYGEWLRRQRRRRDGRDQLRRAYEVFDSIGERLRRAGANGAACDRRVCAQARQSIRLSCFSAQERARRTPGQWRSRRIRRSPPSCTLAQLPSHTTCERCS